MTKRTLRLVSNGRSVYEGARLQPIGALFFKFGWFVFHETPQSMQPLQSCCFAPAWYLYITYTLNLTSSHGQEKGLSITFPHQKDRGQREQCNCTASREIGQYEHLVRRVHRCNPIQDETFKPLKLHMGDTGAWRTVQIFLVWKRRKCSWSKFC